MIFTYLPLSKNVTKIVDMMVIDEGIAKNQNIKLLEYFKNSILELERTLSIFIKVERMRQRVVEDEFKNEYVLDDLLEYIHFCICGERQSVILPHAPMNLDCLIGAKQFTTGLRPKIVEN